MGYIKNKMYEWKIEGKYYMLGFTYLDINEKLLIVRLYYRNVLFSISKPYRTKVLWGDFTQEEYEKYFTELLSNLEYQVLHSNSKATKSVKANYYFQRAMKKVTYDSIYEKVKSNTEKYLEELNNGL